MVANQSECGHEARAVKPEVVERAHEPNRGGQQTHLAGFVWVELNQRAYRPVCLSNGVSHLGPSDRAHLNSAVVRPRDVFGAMRHEMDRMFDRFEHDM